MIASMAPVHHLVVFAFMPTQTMTRRIPVVHPELVCFLTRCFPANRDDVHASSESGSCFRIHTLSYDLVHARSANSAKMYWF